jgi:hypothetical protein
MNSFAKNKLSVVMALMLAVLLIVVSTGVALAFTQSTQVSFTLEGCRNDGSIILPIGGVFVCPDSAYTTGNLGKGWNELDLVPHRLTTSAGNQSGATTDYNVIIAADYQTNSWTGYDVISVPVKNAAKSDASCTISAGPQSTKGTASSPFGGGTDVVIYRELTVHQKTGTTCVFDYYQRLALGAHLYPGSSLQSYMFESGDFSTGKRTLSIPVNQILPQTIAKDMAASQGAGNVWNISKLPDKARLDFTNTCDSTQPLYQKVNITITWNKVQTLSGITIITHIYATNPASRIITVNVSDVIYAGNTQTTAVDTASSGPVDVAANSTQLVLTHTKNVASGPSSFNDIATATYTDTVSGVAVPGTTTATASANVQLLSGGGDTATITDLQSLSEANGGTHLSFSVDSVTGATGSFSGYTVGSKTRGPLSWTSATQNASGSVTFAETVYLDQPSITSGTLSDQATVTDSNNNSSSASSSTELSASALVSLTINKTIPAALSTSQSFDFLVKDSKGNQVATATILVPTGQTSQSATLSLPAGSYTVSEVSQSGWLPLAAQTVNLNLPTCAGPVNFTNVQLGSLAVTKTINWNGITPDSTVFTICITGPSYPSPNANCLPFGGGNPLVQVWTNLLPGQYTVTENDPGSSWTSVVSGTPATVPNNGGGTSAAVSNTRKLGSLLVTKTVNWNGVTPDTSLFFSICIQGPSYPTTPNCNPTGSSGGQILWTNLIPGSYSVSEDPGSAWDVQVTSSPVTVPTNGGQVTASVLNTRKLGSLQVTKSINWNGVAADSGVSFQICITGASYLSGNCKDFNANNGLTQTWTNLIPGSYTVNEPNLGSQWTMTTSGSSVAVLGGATATATVTNTRKLGSLQVTKAVNWNGVATDSSKTFLVCITGPSYSTPSCKSVGYNGGTLTWMNLIPGSYTVTETNPGSAWTVLVTGSPANVPTDGSQATASVSNTFNPGYAKVVKTVSGAPLVSGQSFTFQLRQGASTILSGTTLESANADSTNGGTINFTTKLTPGATYQLCEMVMPGWKTSLSILLTTFVPNSLNDPNVDNSILCGSFTVDPGVTRTFAIDNTPPPGGLGRTIGFWKNWASCASSNGKQKPVLDQTLAKAETAGITIGTLTLYGSITTPDKAIDCLKAVNLLNKSTVNTGKKMASDAAFNMAAQLLAAKLNFVAGATQCAAATTAVSQAQSLLATIKFDGVNHDKMSASQTTQANTLGATLDNYNNNLLCR